MREYTTGATRSNLEGKPQYEGYLSPMVIVRYGQYMLEHQTQEDGKRREADNWQKGISNDDYVDSMWRHFLDVWLIHRGYAPIYSKTMQEALCALLFNAMGRLHESIVRPNMEESDVPTR